MSQYIDKDALVAEIERRIKEYQSTGDDYWFPVIENLKSILSFLDTIEVKEVDLEKEIDNIWNSRFNLGWDEKSLLSMNHEGFTNIAKHFFELGIKTKEE